MTTLTVQYDIPPRFVHGFVYEGARSLLGRRRSQSRRTEWRPRIDWGKPFTVLCSELTIDVRSNQCFECIGNIGILVTASFGAILRKVCVRHIFEQLFVRAIG